MDTPKNSLDLHESQVPAWAGMGKVIPLTPVANAYTPV